MIVKLAFVKKVPNRHILMSGSEKLFLAKANFANAICGLLTARRMKTVNLNRNLPPKPSLATLSYLDASICVKNL